MHFFQGCNGQISKSELMVMFADNYYKDGKLLTNGVQAGV